MQQELVSCTNHSWFVKRFLMNADLLYFCFWRLSALFILTLLSLHFPYWMLIRKWTPRLRSFHQQSCLLHCNQQVYLTIKNPASMKGLWIVLSEALYSSCKLSKLLSCSESDLNYLCEPKPTREKSWNSTESRPRRLQLISAGQKTCKLTSWTGEMKRLRDLWSKI